jgi:hypothetical protein
MFCEWSLEVLIPDLGSIIFISFLSLPHTQNIVNIGIGSAIQQS